MVNTRIIFLLILLSLLYQSDKICAQEKTDPKEWFVEAESYFLFEEYKDALPLYQKILRIDPGNYNVTYKIGVCYLNDVYQKEKSIPYLEKAAANINQNFKLNTFRERLAPPEALYHLGKAYHVNNKFNEAIECYKRFLNTADPNQFDLDVVNEDIEACQLAKKAYNNPVYFSSKSLGTTINSRFEDINPVLSGDGKILAFTRRMQFYDGVFFSVKNEDGSWSEPVNLTEDFSLDGNSYTSGISYFGDEIFVYRSDDYDGNIYSSKRISNKWSRLEKLNDNINTKFWESHASPTPDGQYLIFTSNRDGGYGGLDIYKSKRSTSGEWGVAVNLGPVVNSPSNEETPFISNEGYTLFFSSQGHNTIGGYDVFISNLRSDGTWSKPMNMGYPVNTSDDNIFYYPLGVDNFGLYSLYVPESSAGLNDIYEIEVYNEKIPRTFTVSGNINIENATGKKFKKLSVKLINPKSNQIVKQEIVDDAGNFSIQATQGEYLLVIEGPETETYRKTINLGILQPESVVALSDIPLKLTEMVTEPIQPVITPVITPIVAKKDYYMVTDSASVPIELILPKGSNLEVIISIDNDVILTENISDVKKRFTYFYKPQPGENLLKFTASDKEGMVTTTEVIVEYYPSKPAITSPIARIDSQAKPTDPQLLTLIAHDELSKYLGEIDLSEYVNYFELYDHLIQSADENGFTREEINELFSVFFTQQDEKKFSQEFESTFSEPDTNRSKLAEKVNIPLAYLNSLLNTEYLTEEEMREALLKMQISGSTNPSEFYSDLLDFSSIRDERLASERTIQSIEEAWKLLSTQTNNKSALDALMLLSTTDDLHFFFQNLILNSEEGLHDYLIKLKLEEEGIYTSVDLAEHLFDQAGKYYSAEELIKALEFSRNNKQYFIGKFIEVLAAYGEGTLKSQLMLMDRDEARIEKFEDLFGYLLNQSKYKNYSPESVYSLFIDLIGIDNVKEFADKLESYGYIAINRALNDTTVSYFSNPLELIQYLLAATHTYDFTESDVNNLLIRMILERGLRDRSIREIDQVKEKFWRSRKFVTTFILVNIVLLILILLITLRKRSQK